VLVAPSLEAVLLALAQDALNLVEQGLGDDGWVLAPVFDPAVGDDTEVVAVVQQCGELREGQRSGRALGRSAGHQPLGGHLLMKAPERILTRGVELEHSQDKSCLFWVYLYGPYLVAGGNVANVEVTGWCLVWRAAHASLLRGTFENFSGKVGAVELGQVRQDVADESPGGGVVHVLSHADQSCAGSLDGQLNLHVIGPVAGQPVDLVHDDVVDVAVCAQVRQHPLQLGAGC
jgi:hypothetical protein